MCVSVCVHECIYVCARSPGGVYGVTDGDHVAGPAHIQVGPCEGDQAWVGHGVLVPTDTNSMIRTSTTLNPIQCLPVEAHVERQSQWKY